MDEKMNQMGDKSKVCYSCNCGASCGGGCNDKGMCGCGSSACGGGCGGGRSCGGGSCSGGGCGCGWPHGHRIFRAVLIVIVVLVAFWMGVRAGELRAIFGGEGGYGDYGGMRMNHYMMYGNMMPSGSMMGTQMMGAPQMQATPAPQGTK